MNLFKKFKQIGDNENAKHENKDKKKIENIVFLIIVLIVTIIIINAIFKDDTDTGSNKQEESTYKTLASNLTNSNKLDNNTDISSSELERSLATILTTIKGVGKVNVFINYSESNKIVAMYDEKTTTSKTEETDSSGGLRNTTSTETQKDVIFSEENGDQVPMTEKVIMPTIEGAIITAEGATNTKVKTNIISAVQAATGLSIDKIQVFEMEQEEDFYVEKI